MQGETLGAEIRRVLGTFVPGQLVSPRALSTVTSALEIFPAQMSRVFGFECRLGSEVEQTDFFMRIAPDLGGRDLLAGNSLGQQEYVDRHPAWRRIRQFASDWATPESPLYRDVRHIWFEFDARFDSDDGRLPAILFLHPRAPDNPPPAVWLERQIGLTSRSVRFLTGSKLRLDVKRRLEACLTNLPETAQVFCIGIMVNRPTNDLRLCLKGFHLGEQVPYLARVGFPNAELLTEWLDELGRCVDAVNIDLDIGSRVGATCHLEFRCDEEISPGAAQRWRSFMDILVARRLVLRRKAEAFLEWPRLPLERLWNPETTGLFLHKLSHIKLSWRDGRPLEAKGYFGAWECLRSPPHVRDSRLPSPLIEPSDGSSRSHTTEGAGPHPLSNPTRCPRVLRADSDPSKAT